MEKLPEVLDVPTSAVKESLVVKVRELEDSYRAVQKRSPSFVDEHGWKGLIDKHLANFFAKLDTFLDWLTTHKPRRREQLNNVLIRLDGSRRVLPRSLSDLNVRAWDDKRDFFQKTAHHRGETTEAELLQWLDALELFLLDRLRPRTFDDFDAIDSLLGEDHLDAEA
jgi:hypothetical protein